jgi:septal ring factor EnvC (AmiA/AmiB activator)
MEKIKKEEKDEETKRKDEEIKKIKEEKNKEIGRKDEEINDLKNDLKKMREENCKLKQDLMDVDGNLKSCKSKEIIVIKDFEIKNGMLGLERDVYLSIIKFLDSSILSKV